MIQLSLLHAEFEALHPFLDGNGRLGRMLIPLFLYQAKIIQQPIFYISAYLEAYRDEYYKRLLAVSRDNDWSGWCSFFLQVVKIQAEVNLAKTQAMLDLYNRMKIHFAELTHSQFPSMPFMLRTGFLNDPSSKAQILFAPAIFPGPPPSGY